VYKICHGKNSTHPVFYCVKRATCLIIKQERDKPNISGNGMVWDICNGKTVMAELHVQRKRNSHLLLWLIIIVIILFLAGLFIYGRFDHQEQVIKAKPTSQIQTDYSFNKTINDV
jgi:hypothetical protein